MHSYVIDLTNLPQTPQKYNARALQPDYDGQLAPYQVANVTGFAENLQVEKVSLLFVLS